VIPPPPDDGPGHRGWRWAVAAGLAGVAASTLATALAAAVAGRQSDLALQPVELALRVGLLLVAPCVGAVLAAVVVPIPSRGPARPRSTGPPPRGSPDPSRSTGAPPRGSPDPSRSTGAPPRGSPDPSGRTPGAGGGRLAVVAVGLGVPLGPLLVLRLDRVREFGLATALLTVGVMVAWGVVGAALAAGWWARPGRRVQRTDLPAPLAGPGDADLEASGEPGSRGPAA
jgi:hypothetical protein